MLAFPANIYVLHEKKKTRFQKSSPKVSVEKTQHENAC